MKRLNLRIAGLVLAAGTVTGTGLILAGWLAGIRPRQDASESAPNPTAALPVASTGTFSTVQAGGRFFFAGPPRTAATFAWGKVEVLTNRAYVVGYSESLKDPAWSAYRADKAASLEAPPRPGRFEVDARTTVRAAPADYTNSGYDRGHMTPNYIIAICDSPEAQRETFLMSNIIPQRPALNQKVWMHLEQAIAKDWAQHLGPVWVIAGPVFRTDHPLTRLPAGEAVPDATYMVLARLDHGRPRVLAFLIPQTVRGDEAYAQFLVSVDAVEQATGLDFLSDLPDDIETRVEAETPAATW